MSPRARFPARASGPAERVAGFVAHLRRNGFRLGPGETLLALEGLAAAPMGDRDAARLALRTCLAGCREDWDRFDALFAAYWHPTGRARPPEPRRSRHRAPSRPAIWDAPPPGPAAASAGSPESADDGAGEAEAGGTGRLVASRQDPARRDLGRLATPEELAEAERAARRLARALAHRLSRRRAAARHGGEIDLRRTLRASLSRGGAPIDLARRRRPEEPLRVAALLDVSGSMAIHARVFLAFLRGLVGAHARTEAFLFHTRLMRVTDALSGASPEAAAARLSLMLEGFSGGTRIGHALETFAAGHARRALAGRSLLLVLSDGYDSDPPERLGAALGRLRRRARRIVWLNPLKAWQEHAPVARGIAAARPHLDAHLPAATLADLAALEGEFARL